MNAFPPSWRSASKQPTFKQPMHYHTFAAREQHAASVANWIKAVIILAIIVFLFGCVIACIVYFTPITQ